MSAVGLALQTNPYSGARTHSSYAAWQGGKLGYVLDPQRAVAPLAETVHAEFRSFVGDSGFSCIGAKAALNGDYYRFGFYPQMNTRAATIGLAHDLWEYARERPTFDSDYATFVASFSGQAIVNEQQWEDSLWTQLRNLHDLDRLHYAWDSTVSSDPENPDFSFSFAETGFFVVGLHPASSRIARRFAHPTLVFNFHNQFKRLREQNRFDRMQTTIRARDLKLQGSPNPNLSNFGEASEARQYSGRAVEKEWKCPFRALFGSANNSVVER